MITFEIDIEAKLAYRIFQWLNERRIDFNEQRVGMQRAVNKDSYVKLYSKYLISMDDADGTAFELYWSGNETFYDIIGTTRVRKPFVRENLLS